MEFHAHIVQNFFGREYQLYLIARENKQEYIARIDAFGHINIDRTSPLQEGVRMENPTITIVGDAGFDAMRALALAFVRSGFIAYDPTGKEQVQESLSRAHIESLKTATDRQHQVIEKLLEKSGQKVLVVPEGTRIENF